MIAHLTNPVFVSTLGSVPIAVMMSLPSRKKFAPRTVSTWFVVLVLSIVVIPMGVFYLATSLGWTQPVTLHMPTYCQQVGTCKP